MPIGRAFGCGFAVGLAVGAATAAGLYIAKKMYDNSKKWDEQKRKEAEYEDGLREAKKMKDRSTDKPLLIKVVGKVTGTSNDVAVQVEVQKVDMGTSTDMATMAPQSVDGLKKMAKDLKVQGNVLYTAAHYNDALVKYTEAVQTCPVNETMDLAVFYNNKAVCHQKMNNYSMVIEDCTKCIELNRRYSKAYERRGNAYETLGLLEKALGDFTTVCSMDQSDNKKHITAASRVLEKLTKERTLAAFENHSHPMPSIHTVISFIRDYKNSPLLIADRIASTSDDTPVATSESSSASLTGKQKAKEVQSAQKQFLAGDISVALHLTDDIIQSSPNPPKFYLLRASALYLNGRTEDALTQLPNIQITTDTNPILASTILLQRAGLLFLKGELEVSANLLQQAVDKQENNCDVYYHRGQQNLATLQYENAMLDYHKAVELNSSHIEAKIQRAVTVFKMTVAMGDQNVLAQAVMRVKELVDEYPDNGLIHLAYGQILANLNCYTEALAQFNKAQQLMPQNTDVFINKAEMLKKKGDDDGALEVLHTAINVEPKCVSAYELIGNIEIKRNNVSRARECFSTGMQYAVTNVHIFQLQTMLLTAEAEVVSARNLGESTPL